MKYVMGIAFVAGAACYAQAQQPADQLQNALENMAEETDQVTENDEMWQQLQAYRRHPLDLNEITADELYDFPFLSSLQIQSLLQYRKLLGDFISIYELQAVPQFDLKTIRQLLPYVFVGDRNPFETSYRLPDFFHHGEWNMLLRYKRMVEKGKGYLKKDSLGNTHYLGDPNALFLRIRYQFSGHLSIGITADQDAGEPFAGHGERGFDFYAVHFFLKDYKGIQALALGDYRLNLGQGLINRQGITFGKSGLVMNTDRSGPVLRPHTSAMEYGFYRGAAVSLGKNHFNTTLFVSYKPEDANLIPSDSSASYFKGLQSSGYHRSISELEDKGSVKLFSSGGSLRYNFSKGHVAFNAVYHHFSDSLKRSDEPYDLYGPQGRDMLNASVDYAFFLKSFYFFGETAMDKNNATATVNGLLMSVDKHVDLSLLYRHYSPQYTSLYAQAFGENSRPQNENGFYAGLTLRPLSRWQLDMYADEFRFPWLKYRVDAPSQGSEYFVQLSYAPSKKLSAYLRYRSKQKPLNMTSEEPVAKVITTFKKNIRANIQWSLTDYLTIRERGELVTFHQTDETAHYGYMVAHDVLWKTNKRLTGNFRIAWFHTDDFDTRIYTYENDVRFAYAIPFFYGRGIRSYVNLRLNIGKKISLWTKVSRTWYFGQDTVGSGWDEIEGNKRTNVTLELICKL
jgi:hypothetical protein